MCFDYILGNDLIMYRWSVTRRQSKSCKEREGIRLNKISSFGFATSPPILEFFDFRVFGFKIPSDF